MVPLVRTFSLAFVLLLLARLAVAQTFQWARSGGGPSIDEPSGICVDLAGNSYVIGTFSDTATFGSFAIVPTPSITTFSTKAVFITKYNPDGQEIWVKKLSDSNLDFGNDIAVDSAGYLYVTGGFSGTAHFGATALVSSAFGDMFIAKYDPDGNLIWVKKGGGSSFTIGNSIALDKAGNSLVTGYFRATVNFGDFRLNSKGKDDMFLVKYDAAGNVLWARSAGGTGGSAVGTEVAVTSTGACYITGFFYGATDFGTVTLPGNPDQGNKTDVFVAKYEPDGALVWANQIINPQEDTPGGISTDQEGNCYVTGSFTGSAGLGTFTLTSKGAEDVFICKYNPSGKVLWAKNVGGPGADAGRDISFLDKETLFLTGTYSGRASIGNSNLVSKGATDIFISKWDTSGIEKFTTTAGGTSPDKVNKMALDSTGNAYVTGSISGEASFGSISLNSRGEQDVVVAKFGIPFSGPATITISSFGRFNYCAGPDITIPFRTSGVFNQDNSFIAQLSDATGSFAFPVVIGTGSGSPIKASIPVNTPVGAGYKIRIVSNSPPVISDTSETDIAITDIGLRIPVPNIITPNGDGLNDTFRFSFGCLTVNLYIFNRWGKLVYEQANYQNTWSGDNLPEGSYFYQLQTSTGQIKKGWVEISR